MQPLPPDVVRLVSLTDLDRLFFSRGADARKSSKPYVGGGIVDGPHGVG